MVEAKGKWTLNMSSTQRTWRWFSVWDLWDVPGHSFRTRFSEVSCCVCKRKQDNRWTFTAFIDSNESTHRRTFFLVYSRLFYSFPLQLIHFVLQWKQHIISTQKSFTTQPNLFPLHKNRAMLTTFVSRQIPESPKRTVASPLMYKAKVCCSFQGCLVVLCFFLNVFSTVFFVFFFVFFSG